jgi:hypothetical protein
MLRATCTLILGRGQIGDCVCAGQGHAKSVLRPDRP